jgi:hypothetical protein
VLKENLVVLPDTARTSTLLQENAAPAALDGSPRGEFHFAFQPKGLPHDLSESTTQAAEGFHENHASVRLGRSDFRLR